jgi:hypothetical protein
MLKRDRASVCVADLVEADCDLLFVHVDAQLALIVVVVFLEPQLSGIDGPLARLEMIRTAAIAIGDEQNVVLATLEAIVRV